MSNQAKADWIQMNQQYLIAAVNALKAELQLHLALIENETETEALSSILDQSRNELSKLEEKMPAKAALTTLSELFNLSDFEKKILTMCAGIELDANFAQLIKTLNGNSPQMLPTFSLALSTFANAHWSALTPEGPLRYWRLIELNNNKVLTNAGCTIDENILHYLTGISALDHRLTDFVKISIPKDELVSSHQELSKVLIANLSHLNKAENYPLIQVLGNSTEDKLAIITKTFGLYNFSTFRLSGELLPNNFQELSNFILLWNRVAALNRYVLFLDGSQLQSLDTTLQYYVKHLIDNIQGIVVLASTQKLSGIQKDFLTIDVDKPLREEQEVLWKQCLGLTSISMDTEIGEVATQFSLDTHSIKNLAKLIVIAGKPSNGLPQKVELPTINKEEIWKVCCDHTRPNLEQYAQRIEPQATWNDLVLPEMQKNILKEVCIHVQQRQRVYYEWGFANKSKRGLGISALFSGESGTGKTMAAEVLANALQLDLFRIDLSQVVNKYIGETEKNLKKIFDAAEASGAILLFDEADALFGKRSDVKDSHDRYSNIEVSYLLQKMESYRGLAILTSNLKNALDKAFLRRIRFTIPFPFPDNQMRGEIWKRAFPKQTPTRNLNINKLALLNVAGGNIKNIAMNASFAAADKNRSVSMLDIQNAARNEYIKLEKQMSAAESLL